MTEQNPDSALSQGWRIVQQCSEALKVEDYMTVRRQLAAYFKLGISRPGRLHSAILSIAVKMVPQCSEFHLVPFLDMWGLENLTPEDSEAKTTEDGKRFPSLVERMAKAYAYAILFHPNERLESDLENLLFPFLQKRGFIGIPESVAIPMLATRTLQKEVKGAKRTFVSLITAKGYEVLTEVHTLTAHQRMRYGDIPGRLFNVLLRQSEEKGRLRIEAAVPSTAHLADVFPTTVGYVDHIDLGHDHLHIFDNESRHMVAEHSHIRAKVGDFVLISPIVPVASKFKTAIIHHVFSPEEGPAAFGYRPAKVTYVDPTKGYAAWELLPEADGTIRPIIETGTTEPSFTKGYLHSQASEAQQQALPSVDTVLSLIVFLKRGKDGAKHPYVVTYK